jgi:hypothetical protein
MVALTACIERKLVASGEIVNGQNIFQPSCGERHYSCSLGANQGDIMKSVFALLLVLTSAFTAFADSPEFTKFEAALRLIAQRNANQVCENDAYHESIIEMTAQAIAEDGEKLPSFIARIPKNSDILQNLQFRALLENADLEKLTNANSWQNLLTNTRYFSRAGGVFGPAYVIELKENGKALLYKTEVLDKEPFRKVRRSEATWRASIEIEPGADYYQFVDIDTSKEKLLYLLKRNIQGSLLLEETKLKSDDDRSILFFSPDDCSI